MHAYNMNACQQNNSGHIQEGENELFVWDRTYQVPLTGCGTHACIILIRYGDQRYEILYTRLH
jgi:hypothetical protein